jgi:hypothetical protein
VPNTFNHSDPIVSCNMLTPILMSHSKGSVHHSDPFVPRIDLSPLSRSILFADPIVRLFKSDATGEWITTTERDDKSTLAFFQGVWFTSGRYRNQMWVEW